ncbi:flagellar biosynthetic protein FliO [Arsukibacterium sp.]|uniref:flagellar biosynthetic protein FliO n=1 Tax=Arsukibacterium sp. TaxID=1977258 RepID=UPI00299D7605|nr:flagellar biosynthetic protein FliO [Arsukibacterium sp.]MDX1677861.1 flagellar biosynthetic protein FliO [Arsukibacterium sp.]
MPLFIKAFYRPGMGLLLAMLLALTLPVLATEPVTAEPAPQAVPEESTEQQPTDVTVSPPEAVPQPEAAAAGAGPASELTATADPRQGVPFTRQEPAQERKPGPGISLAKIAISLAAVVLLVVALGWLFKKLTLRLPGSQHVKVICSVPLGQRERLLVIEIQGKQRVLGVTPHSINMLFELENSLPETKLASDFHTQLQSFLKK